MIYGAHAKQLIYENVIETENQLWEYIQNAFTIIFTTAGIFERVRQSLVRMKARILAEARNFEHLFIVTAKTINTNFY